MTAGQTPGPEPCPRAHPGPVPITRAPSISVADLTESMMATYGDQLPLDVIARTVHDVLDAHDHPRGAPVPAALRRRVLRRLRELSSPAGPSPRPPLSPRAKMIARALQGRR